MIYIHMDVVIQENVSLAILGQELIIVSVEVNSEAIFVITEAGSHQFLNRK